MKVKDTSGSWATNRLAMLDDIASRGRRPEESVQVRSAEACRAEGERPGRNRDRGGEGAPAQIPEMRASPRKAASLDSRALELGIVPTSPVTTSRRFQARS